MSKPIHYFTKRAKELTKLARRADAAALKRISRVYGHKPDPLTGFGLMQAQHTVAVEHGFRGWTDLLHQPEHRLREAIHAAKASSNASLRRVSFRKPGSRAHHAAGPNVPLDDLFRDLRGKGGLIDVDWGHGHRETWRFKSWPNFSGWQEERTARWRREPHDEGVLDLGSQLIPAVVDLPAPRTPGKVARIPTRSLLHVPVKVRDGGAIPIAPECYVVFTCEHLDGAGAVWIYTGILDVKVRPASGLAAWLQRQLDDALVAKSATDRRCTSVSVNRVDGDAVHVIVEIT